MASLSRWPRAVEFEQCGVAKLADFRGPIDFKTGAIPRIPAAYMLFVDLLDSGLSPPLFSLLQQDREYVA